MNVQWKNGVALITGVSFDVQLNLIDSAQSFVWREHDGGFAGCVFDSAVRIEQIEDGLRIYPVAQHQVEDYLHYLDLMRDYGALMRRYAMFPQVVRAFEATPGLRVLNQPVWDVLLSFILSANNNVSRITKLVWLLGEHFGEPHRLGELVLHAMPTPEALAATPEGALRALGFGYRAPFLVRTAQMVTDGFPLDALREMPYDEAHAELVKLPGVGDKVADCVLLFGCGHASAFPVDVWVARLMGAWFPDFAGQTSRLKIQRAAREMLGDDAGIVQQFMFHCARCGLLPLDG